jgi:O-Antigen ligase
LAAALPFELVRPVAPLGPLQLSSVEVFLYATLGSWLAARCAGWVPQTGGGGDGGARRGGATRAGFGVVGRWRRLSEVHRAAALWSLVLLLSALLAPLARASAVKFALRSLGGVTLLVAASDLLDSRRAIRRALTALAAGAVVAALLMALEIGVGGRLAALLRPFHAQTFGILGLARASGPFQYPNIATMYLEAVLPVLVATGVVWAGEIRSRHALRAVAVTAVAALAIIYGTVLAASRAGLVTALLGLIGVAVLARELPTLRRLSIGLAGGLVAVTLIAQAASPLLALRLRVWQERSWYASVIEPTPDSAPLPSPLPVGTDLTIALSIRNIGALPWAAGGKKPVRVSYHWMSEDAQEVVVLDGARSDLPGDVVPGAKVDLLATVTTPARPGSYLLWWDLVHEKVTWFSDTGDLGLWQPAVVGAPAAGKGKGKGRTPRSVLTPNGFNEFSRAALWWAGWLAFRDHPLLGLGPDNFRHAYGDYLGRKDSDSRLHANNFYVEILATMGILGLLALVTLMVALARTARRAAGARDSRVLTFGVSAGLAAYFVHGALDYFLEFTPTYALFWLLTGTLVALERLAARVRNPGATAELLGGEGGR